MKGKLLKFLAAILFLLLVAGATYWGLLYLKFIQVPEILKDKPYIAQLLPIEPVKPETVSEVKTNFPLVSENNSKQSPAEPVVPPKAAENKQDTARISKLAKMYSNMKPDEAVKIINQLDDPLVVAIFNKMDDEQVGKILALLDAKRAADITKSMAQVQSPQMKN